MNTGHLARFSFVARNAHQPRQTPSQNTSLVVQTRVCREPSRSFGKTPAFNSRLFLSISKLFALFARLRETFMTIRSIVVAAICTITCAAASPAFADDDSSAVFGSATLTSLQDLGGNAKGDASSASLGADALRSVSGNVGVNLAAGALNAQANQIALISTPQADITSRQTLRTTTQMSGSAIAEVGAGAMTAVSGNVGVNIAGGVGNAQFNGMVVH
jgi:hypothetical protein